MKIQVDGVDLYTVTDTEMELMAYFMFASTLDDDCKRRLQWVLKHKIEQCYKKIRIEWMPILQADPNVTEVPLDDEAFFNMIKVRSDYQDRDARDTQQAAAERTP